MKRQVIHVDVSADGKTDVNVVSGFAGKACLKVTEAREKALGSKVAKREEKAEMAQTESVATVKTGAK
jgi:fatty acid/phospholipid biosynthesis enzyme